MPSGGLICNRCRAGDAEDGDTWCLVCQGAASITEAAKHKFAAPNLRALGGEIVAQASRQLKGLVEIDKQFQSHTASLSDRLAHALKAVGSTTAAKSAPRHPSPRGTLSLEPRARDQDRSSKAAPLVEPKEEAPDYDDESFAESGESEEVVRAGHHSSGSKPERDTALRPRSPDHPPRGREAEKREKARSRSRSRNRGRRGGNKHKQRFRQIYNQGAGGLVKKNPGSARQDKRRGPPRR